MEANNESNLDQKILFLQEAMMEKLQQIELTSENILQQSEQSYKVVKHYLAELKNYIISYTFADKQEEINFFKKMKPMFLKELIYHFEVFQVEAWKPPVGREEQIAHYKLGAHRADLYFKRYNELYTYYRKKSSEHDEHYFLREAAFNELSAISESDIDSRFCTIYSFRFSKLQAYEQFSDYLHECVANLENPASQTTGEKGRPATIWTDSKTDLTELAYSLYAKGSINNGKADIKQIVTTLESMFKISLGNFYRTFQNLRLRKKNRTPFLDTAKHDLIKTMDSSKLDY